MNNIELNPYKIYITSVHWNSEQNENIRFDTVQARNSYFNIPAIFENSSNVNFNINDGLNSSAIVYSEDINIINSNYAIIDCGDAGNPRYLFYFIERCIHQSSLRCYELILKLDVIQTYYIDLKFDNSIIKRCHLERYITHFGDDTYAYYRYSNLSDLYKGEFTEGKKDYISKSIDILPNPYRYNDKTPDEYNKDIRNWLLENVECWVYVFLKPFNKTLNKYYRTEITDQGIRRIITTMGQISITTSDSKYYTKSIDNNITVLCAPIYKTNKRMYLMFGTDDVPIIYDNKALVDFINFYDLSSYVITRKYSRRSPFLNYCDYYESTGTEIVMNVVGNELHIRPTIDRLDYLDLINLFRSHPENDRGIVLNIRDIGLLPQLLFYKDGNNYSYLITSNKYKKTKSSIKNTLTPIQDNPKVDIFCKELNITDGLNNFSITESELSATNLYLEYYENVNLDVTHYNIFIYQNKVENEYEIDSLYNNKTGLYIGFSNSLDLSIPFNIEQIDVYLSNNKNFFLQSMLPNMRGMITGNIKGALINSVFQGIDTMLTLDNLSNAPDTVQNLKNDSVGLVDYNGLRLRLQYKQMVPALIRTFNDTCYRYGYSYNELSNIKDKDNIRKYFNYIESDICGVTFSNGLSISKLIYNELKRIFNNGITLWNKTNDTQNLFKYNVNNYENILE